MLVNKNFDISFNNRIIEYGNIGNNTAYSMYGDEFPVAPQAGIKPFVQPTMSEKGFQFGTGDYNMLSQFQPNNALKDDNSIILWQEGYPAYLYMCYQYPLNITKLTIRNMNGRMPYHYEVYVSEDFDHWTKIKEGINTNNISFSTWDIDLTDTNYHKFYKLNILDNQRDSTGQAYYTVNEMGFEYIQITATYKETTFTPLEGTWTYPVLNSYSGSGLTIDSDVHDSYFPAYNFTNPNQYQDTCNAVMDGASFPFHCGITNNEKIKVKQVIVGNQGWKGNDNFAGRITKDWIFEYKNDDNQWVELARGTNSNYDSYCESDGTLRPDGFFVINVPNPVYAYSYRITVLNTTKSFIYGTYHTNNSVVFSYINFIADTEERIEGNFVQPIFTQADGGFESSECTKDNFTIYADSFYYSEEDPAHYGVAQAFDGNHTPNGQGHFSANNAWHSGYDGNREHYIGFRYYKPLKVYDLKVYNGPTNVTPYNWTLQCKINNAFVNVTSGTNTTTNAGDSWVISTDGTYVSDDWRILMSSSTSAIAPNYVGVLEIEINADVIEE